MLRRIGDRPDGFEVVLFPEPMPDPVGDPEQAKSIVVSYVDAGATMLNLRLRSDSLAHCLEQLDATARMWGA
jgi:hypothetical protein